MSRAVVIRASSGIFHRGYRLDGALLTSAPCNLDSATETEVLDDLPVDTPPESLCERCMTETEPAQEEPS